MSGYNLDALASDEPDWARLLCGSEGTLAVTIGATLRLEPLPERRGLAIYRYRTVDEALDAVADLLPTEPSAIELLDRAMVDPRNRAPATASLTAFADRADAMLVVEYQGPSERVGERLAGATGALIVDDPAEQAAVWQVRRSGIARALGLARGDAKPLAFIEDPAVPPDRLASFAKAVRAVLAREELPATWYGHASVGCLHIRPMLDLRAPGAVATMRRVAEAVADLVVAHGGSLSGEHGDGRLRGELLPKMYRPETIQAFAALKRLADPDRLLNPGVIVDPEPLDANLRLAASPPLAAHRTALNFAAEGGLARAAEACTNNGACRADAGAMCPSFQALGDERHSTRGRAVLLRAALEGKLEGGLANPDLHEALDLCLGCKACKSDCPAGVDMARLKIEALAHRRHRSLTGHAHRLLAAASRMPHLAGAIGATVSRLRGVPVPQPRRAWTASPTANLGDPFTLFADTFTRFLHPDLGDDAIRVLEATGANVRVVAPGCCGRPLLSQGRVAAARRTLTATLAGLTDATGPIVVLEPSCWSMFTDDATTLLDRTDLLATAANIRLFEEVVAQRGGPFGEVDTPGVVHPHCHVRALGAAALALDPIARVAERSRLSSAGCCGMAGAFGYSHPRESKLIGRQALARLAPGRGEQIVAAGTSCRAQFTHLTGQVAQHPATFLARGLAD